MAYNKIVFDSKTLIDLTDDTVTADKLAEGTTAHDASGNVITGTMTSGTTDNTLHVTFASSLTGCEYIITNGNETLTGVVPDDCVLDVTVTGSGEYTVECEGTTATVTVTNVYEVEVGEEIPVYANYIAFYSANDSSLNFCGVDTVPATGSQLLGKTVTTVYTGMESTGTNASSIPWYSDRTNFTFVIFDSSFANAKPVRTAYWFYNFTNCESITGLKYLDTFNVTSMAYMFQDCSGLTSLDVSNFNTSNVTSMTYMFYNCSGLTSLSVSNFDTSKVTNMTYMFNSCSGLTSLSVSNFTTSAVTNMNAMFRNCSKLTTIYSDDSKFVTTKVTSDTNMFYNCTKLVGGNGTVFDSSKVDSSMAHVDTASNPGYFTKG